ncbi:glycogen debranching N-terminal domain-containing protein [Xenophilus aerolatus]
MTTPPSEPKPAVEDSLPTAPDRSLRQLFVLKEGDSFLVADAYGDVSGEGDGFFHDDTRLLSAWRVLINGTLPTLLSSAVSQDNVYFSANLNNRPLPALGETSTPQGVLHMERRRLLWDGRIYERITVHNYSDAPVQVPLQIRFAADFRDMFEVRGVDRARRGRLGPGEVDGCRVTLGYEGLDEVHRAVVLSFAPMPAALSAREAGYRLELGPRELAGPCGNRCGRGPARRLALSPRGRAGALRHAAAPAQRSSPASERTPVPGLDRQVRGRPGAVDDHAAERPLSLRRDPLVLHALRARCRHHVAPDVVAAAPTGGRGAGVPGLAPGARGLGLPRRRAREDHARDAQG